VTQKLPAYAEHGKQLSLLRGGLVRVGLARPLKPKPQTPNPNPKHNPKPFASQSVS